MEGQTKTDSAKKKPFYPLAVGNYWTYSNSNNSGTVTKRITKTEVINGDSVYKVEGEHGYEMYFERNDTVFTLDQGEPTGKEMHWYLKFCYFPSDEKKQFIYIDEGDVMMSKEVSKIDGKYECNGNLYTNCYMNKVKNFNQQYGVFDIITIVAWGIGVIEIKYLWNTMTLIDYKIK